MVTYTLDILIQFLFTTLTTIAGCGATIIITKSVIFRPSQRMFNKRKHPMWHTLMNCPLCMGTHIGFWFEFTAILVYRLMIYNHAYLLWTDIMFIAYQGFITGLMSYIVYCLMVCVKNIYLQNKRLETALKSKSCQQKD